MLAGQVTRQQRRAKARAHAERQNSAIALNARGERLAALGPKKQAEPKKLIKLDPEAQALFNQFSNHKRSYWNRHGKPVSVSAVRGILENHFI